MARIKGMIEIYNYPDANMSNYPFCVVRLDDSIGKLWYYGSFDYMERAIQAAKEIGGFIVTVV